MAVFLRKRIYGSRGICNYLLHRHTLFAPKYCLLKMVRTKLTSVDNFGPVWHTVLKQQHSHVSSLLLAYCFPKECMGSRMVWGTCTTPHMLLTLAHSTLYFCFVFKRRMWFPHKAPMH